MKKLIIGLAILSLIIAVYIGYVMNVSEPSGTAYYTPTLPSATTTTAISVGASTRIMATSTNPLVPDNSFDRVYATICNPSTTLVYVNMNNDKPASVSAAQVVIGAVAGYNACFEIDERNHYNGSITASSTNQTATSVIVSDFVR